jgi:acetyl esterase
VVGDTLLLEPPARLVAELAQVTVVSVEYRRAPEDPFPAAFDDCLAAVRWASHKLADGLPVVVFGESAGGNLAAAVTASVAADPDVALAGQVVVVPALDPAMTTGSWARFGDGYGLDRGEMEWFWNSYLSDPSDRTDPRACPTLATSLGRCPPTTVVTCGYDPLQDEGDAFARLLDSAGVPLRHVHFDSLPHGFFWTAGSAPAALKALQHVAAEVERLVATA